MFKEILVPTDFSEHASQALRLAVKIARHGKGRVTLLHIGLAPGMGQYDLGNYGVPVPETFVQMHEEAAKEQKHALERLARQEVPEDVPWHALTREGFPPDEIAAQVREGKHDLVVMGTHGRTGLQRAFLGSVTERVLRQSTVPVLVTR